VHLPTLSLRGSEPAVPVASPLSQKPAKLTRNEASKGVQLLQQSAGQPEGAELTMDSQFTSLLPSGSMDSQLPKGSQFPVEREVRSHHKVALASRIRSVRHHVSHKAKDDIKSIRPSASAGVPDVVRFGVFTKNFFGAALKQNKFTVDAIVAVSWNDTRVSALVPPGLDRLSMSGKQALSTIWMPEVIVTNRDIRRWDVISTGVTIFKTGEVMKIERASYQILQMFELSQYPFDTQDLLIKVASGKYMLNEVVLEPDEDESISGAKKEIFEGTGYALKKHRVFAFAETDGALKKSRGVLELTVKRLFDKYKESHLMPTCLLLMISWAVFWFPFQNPFITPRLALSILCLIAFTNLMVKSSGELPDGAPNNWNDTFNFQVQVMMFFTIVINIFSEVCKHQVNLEELAQSINHEAKIVLPCLSLVNCGLVMGSGAYGWMSLGAAGVVTKLVIVIGMGSYFSVNMSRLKAAHAEKTQKEQFKKENDEIEAQKKENERVAAKAKQQSLGPGAVVGLGADAADAGEGGGDA